MDYKVCTAMSDFFMSFFMCVVLGIKPRFLCMLASTLPTENSLALFHASLYSDHLLGKSSQSLTVR